MKSIIILFSLFSFHSFASGPVAESPKSNECLALPSTKKYLSSDFESYPRNVIFNCTYICNANEILHQVEAISNVTIKNFDEDARLTACQGVVVKKTKWGYDFDKVEAFYAPDTKLVELKQWAMANIDFNPSVNHNERTKLEKLKVDLNKVSSSFITAGSAGGEATRYFRDAGLALGEIALDLPMNTEKLDKVISRILGPNNGQGNQATDLVDLFIKTSASWRIPIF